MSDWQFLADEQWDQEVSDGYTKLVTDLRDMDAGTATLKALDKEDRPLGLRSIGFCGPVEVAIEVDCKTGEVIWGWRYAPLCDECGAAPDEDHTQYLHIMAEVAREDQASDNV